MTGTHESTYGAEWKTSRQHESHQYVYGIPELSSLKLVPTSSPYHSDIYADQTLSSFIDDVSANTTSGVLI
ncbi:hypothetical protein Hypma_016599 [Hypsizygus marmoreus]|uniref:Uncharacterized protein n=1 Tax=Hypsizygus marmoreus TaxID=39966 RepID=A0A369J511_HYPMA|nr:hypothetical protein Hypma_016599 [Hypsizygus marmoreus]